MDWKAWEDLCILKGKGGLGFKTTKSTNKALLAKLACMIANKCDSLCMEILRTKYKVRHDWLHKDPHRKASPIWRAIENAKEIIVKGACYLIRDGASVSIWQDPWVPWLQGFIPKPKAMQPFPTLLTVSQLINQNSHEWKSELVHEIFEAKSAQAILSIHLPAGVRPDKLIWVLDPKGRFSVRSAYRVFTTQIHNNTDIPWTKLWNLRALERVKMLLWRIGSNATKENLIQRIGSIDPTCVLCNQENKTGPHMFFKCPIARAMWYLGCWGFRSEDHHLC